MGNGEAPHPRNVLDRTKNNSSQMMSLDDLVGLAKTSMLEPRVRVAAIRMISSCPKTRDAAADFCELRAIYNGVKNGDGRVAGLGDGLRYVPDPRGSDYFVAPHRLLEWCEDGACGEDCDSHAMLVIALAGAVGFHVGLRVWGNLKKSGYQHVYGMVHFPKKEPFQREISLDTTVASADVGWTPPKGRIQTQWLPR